MKYVDYELMRQKLQNGEITWLEAYDIIVSSTIEPWDTKEWEEKRLRYIGTECIMCGRKNGDPCTKGYYEYLRMHGEATEERPKVHLVLQHSWHPDTIEYTIKNLVHKFKEEYDGYFKQTVYTRGANNISVRGISGDELEYVHKRLRVRFIDTRYPELGKQAIYQYLDDLEKYMSMSDTSTYCSNCAEREDNVGRIICPLCKDRYISQSSVCCYECENTDEGQLLIKKQEEELSEKENKLFEFLNVIETEEEQLQNKYFYESLSEEEKLIISNRLKELKYMKNNFWKYI